MSTSTRDERMGPDSRRVRPRGGCVFARHGTTRRATTDRRIERGMGTHRAFVVVAFACVVAHAFCVREVEVRCVRARTPLERLKD